jgi:hypothetical protein
MVGLAHRGADAIAKLRGRHLPEIARSIVQRRHPLERRCAFNAPGEVIRQPLRVSLIELARDLQVEQALCINTFHVYHASKEVWPLNDSASR